MICTVLDDTAPGVFPGEQVVAGVVSNRFSGDPANQDHEVVIDKRRNQIGPAWTDHQYHGTLTELSMISFTWPMRL